MQVILREDVNNLGTRGEVVKVKDGYARNFLLPRKLAVVATESNMKIVAQEKEAHLRKEAKLAAEAADLAKLLAPVVLTFSRKAGEDGHLFGSVTAQDIADALAAQKFTVDRKKIQLAEPIKVLGETKVPVKLHREVTAELTVTVAKDGE